MLPRETILTVGVEQFSGVVFLVSSIAGASDARPVYSTSAPGVEYIEPAPAVSVAAPAPSFECLTTALNVSNHCRHRTVLLPGSVVWSKVQW